MTLTYIKQTISGPETQTPARVCLQGPVSYSVTGNPTVTNGIASGFSAEDCFALPRITAAAGTAFEVQMVFTTWTGTRQTNNDLLYAAASVGSYTCRIYVIGGKLNFIVTYDNNRHAVALDYTLEAATTYKVKYVYDGFVLTGYLYNASGTLLADVQLERNDICIAGTGAVKIGSNQNASYCEGSIDLNETYIKLNGKLWFGRIPVKKVTCNAVTVWEA